jgi:GNAT superfamily N-acetyltransferase
LDIIAVVETSPDKDVPFAVTVESPHSPEAARLIQDLSTELGARYGDDGSGAFRPADVEVPGGAFVVARLGDWPVGCGAVRPLEPGVAEVKRMFVDPAARRRGIARRILGKLEEVARELGYQAVRLETGTLQQEAIGLYESAGYYRVPCYGQYTTNPLSVCYEKRLQ